MGKGGPKTWVEISKNALVSNAKIFKRRAGASVAVMAVVKSNAYGHGLVEVAKTVQPHLDWFGVDNVDEGLALRKAGIKKPILILGFTPSWRMQDAIRAGLRMTVSTREQVHAAKSAAKKAAKRGYLHVKAETGTTRQGAELRELPDIAEMIKSAKHLVLEGLSTHYANIEDATDHDYAAGQLETYQNALEILEAHGFHPDVKHTACTAAAVLYPDTHFNLVRVGIGLYGLWPSLETRLGAQAKGLEIELQPALAWKTTIAQVKDVKRGTPVSYGLTEKMPRTGKVAVLGVGYWDGYDRGLSSVGEVVVRGRKAKVLGRVCMNMCMIDVTDIPDVRAEDEVILLGEDGRVAVTADDLAHHLDTINYEIVTRINPLLPRKLV
ncbi:MAG: alanine racemase [Patescibacteria group bacterium]|nr:MAG: alanine racemase [Patescibacteria group bacterium]